MKQTLPSVVREDHGAGSGQTASDHRRERALKSRQSQQQPCREEALAQRSEKTKPAKPGTPVPPKATRSQSHSLPSEV